MIRALAKTRSARSHRCRNLNPVATAALGLQAAADTPDEQMIAAKVASQLELPHQVVSSLSC